MVGSSEAKPNSIFLIRRSRPPPLPTMSSPRARASRSIFWRVSQEDAKVVEQILDESDAVGLMQLQCTEAKDDASAMIFPTTDTLSLQQQVNIEEDKNDKSLSKSVAPREFFVFFHFRERPGTW